MSGTKRLPVRVHEAVVELWVDQQPELWRAYGKLGDQFILVEGTSERAAVGAWRAEAESRVEATGLTIKARAAVGRGPLHSTD